jgi:hypothetical protein
MSWKTIAKGEIMAVNLSQEIAAKVAVLPLAQQQAVLQLVETMSWGWSESATAANQEENSRLLASLLERMRSNPIPANAPRYTREELHERR